MPFDDCLVWQKITMNVTPTAKIYGAFYDFYDIAPHFFATPQHNNFIRVWLWLLLLYDLMPTRKADSHANGDIGITIRAISVGFCHSLTLSPHCGVVDVGY